MNTNLPEEDQKQTSNYNYFYNTNLDKFIPVKPLPDKCVSFCSMH